MALTDTSTKLGCGRDIDEVWDHLNQAPDPHELTCPFCRAARADLAGLQQATASLRADETTDPERQPGPQILERILAVARAEVRRGRRLPLDQPGPDRISPHTISEQAITAVIWRTADLDPRVQVRRCRIELDDTADPADAAPTQPVVVSSASTVAMFLKVSVGSGSPIGSATNQLRAAVIQAVTREVGMYVSTVSIEVEDIHDL